MTSSSLSSDYWRVPFGCLTVRPPAREHSIQRPRARAHDEQKDQPQQHREIGARFVHHAQESVARKLGQREGPESVSGQDRDFRREDGYRDVDEQRDRRQAAKQADKQERTTNGLHRADERPHYRGRGNPNLSEPTSTQRLGIKNLLDALQEEHRANQQADEDDGRRRLAEREFGFRVYAVVLSFDRDVAGLVRHAASLFFS